jgi:hypothetical protein
MARRQEQYRLARSRYQDALAIAHEFDDELLLQSLLEGFASLAVAEGQPARAARLLGAGEALWGRSARHGPSPRDSDNLAAAARAALGEAAFSTAWAEGQTMTREQAIACARDLGDA